MSDQTKQMYDRFKNDVLELHEHEDWCAFKFLPTSQCACGGRKVKDSSK